MREEAQFLFIKLIESKSPVVDYETKVLSTELQIRGST